MKTKQPKYLLPAALAAVLPSVIAADSPYAPVPENRVFLNGRLGLNLRVRFADLAARQATVADPGPNLNGVARRYDDGFVGVDAGGNAGGRTWYWGYEDNAQYDPAFGTLTYHAAVNTGNDLTHTEDADPQPGFSLGYTRLLGHTGRLSWGVSLIGGWMAIDARDAVAVSSQEGSVIDLYTLGSVVPPPAPYSGTSAGPGPSIPDRPTYRLSAVDPVDRSINRKLHGDIWNLQLGPTARIDLCRHAACTLGAGVSLALLDAKLSYAGTTVEATVRRPRPVAAAIPPVRSGLTCVPRSRPFSVPVGTCSQAPNGSILRISTYRTVLRAPKWNSRTASRCSWGWDTRFNRSDPLAQFVEAGSPRPGGGARASGDCFRSEVVASSAPN